MGVSELILYNYHLWFQFVIIITIIISTIITTFKKYKVHTHNVQYKITILHYRYHHIKYGICRKG